MSQSPSSQPSASESPSGGGAISRAALAGEPDPLLVRFNASIGVDKRLALHDIRGSQAHATMLGAQGIIPQADASAIVAGLDSVREQIAAGQMEWRLDLEDIHTHVERSLQQKIGTPAGRLHTGRSRNDQVATDVRLYLTQEAAPQLTASIRGLMAALVGLARAHEDAILPGYTHMQRAQPILFAHHLLAYVEMFGRDLGRIEDARRRADACPLGSGAIAGSPLPLDRALVARTLGFATVTRNSMDATASRDALVEFVSACAITMTNLSRWCEELCIWSTSEFQFVQLSDGYCTGSSLMPQKRNPDAPELARGKTARVVGDLMALLTLLKGLPLAYNKDLQEDKAPVFDAVDTTCEAFDVMAGATATLEVRVDRMFHAAADPFLLCTDIADALVEQGMPFREAHHVVGAAVRESVKSGRPLPLIPDAELSAIHPQLPAAVVAKKDARASIAARQVVGGPAPERVAEELARWESVLAS